MVARSTSGVLPLRGSDPYAQRDQRSSSELRGQFGTLAFALACLMQVSQSRNPPSSTSLRIVVFLLFRAFDRLLCPAERSL